MIYSTKSLVIMSLSWEFKKDDPKTLILLWEGNCWREVPKYLFFNELKKVSAQRNWDEFLSYFNLLEEKIAKRQSIALLSKRNYLSSDLESRLLAKGLSPQAAKAAVLYCQEKGFVNDTQEIARLIAREQKKGLGAKAIYFKLKQKKKIDDKQLRRGLDQTEISEKEALEKWLVKNSKKVKWNDPLEMRKLMAKLMRRGFSGELVFDLLRK